MSRTLELYDDGRLYEYEDEQAIRVTDTQGQVASMIEALRFSTATTLTTVAKDKQAPSVPMSRGGRRIHNEGFQLLTTFEGCELVAYDDGGNVWTIGYGHTQGVVEGMIITQDQANEFLRTDLEKFETYVKEAVTVSLNEDQFSALVCFCFNVGPGKDGFGGSTLLRLLNKEDYSGAAKQFPRWNKVKRKSWLGLTRRRLAEQALFTSQPWVPFRTYDGPVDVFGVDALGVDAFGLFQRHLLQLTEPSMVGEDVQRLQAALMKANFELGAEPAKGVFGKLTDVAVREFQSQKSLKVDGVVGEKTWGALGL